MQTEEGVAMGTPGYMSPEQVRGLPAAYRSGIFGLGLVLQKPSRPRALMTENADHIVEEQLVECVYNLGLAVQTEPQRLER